MTLIFSALQNWYVNSTIRLPYWVCGLNMSCYLCDTWDKYEIREGRSPGPQGQVRETDFQTVRQFSFLRICQYECYDLTHVQRKIYGKMFISFWLFKRSHYPGRIPRCLSFSGSGIFVYLTTKPVSVAADELFHYDTRWVRTKCFTVKAFL